MSNNDITKFDKFQSLNRNNFEFIICFIYIELKIFNIDICFSKFFFQSIRLSIDLFSRSIFSFWSIFFSFVIFSTFTTTTNDLSKFDERSMTNFTCFIHHVNTKQMYFFDKNATFEKYFWIRLYVDCFTSKTCSKNIWENKFYKWCKKSSFFLLIQIIWFLI